MGIVLNPFYGCNCKYAAVLTNLELETDGYVDFGLEEYCENCTICAEQCPPHAIPRGKRTLYNGYYTWKLNARACSDFGILNKEGTVCGRCTKVCPWHRPDMGPRDFASWDGSLRLWEASTGNQLRQWKVSNHFSFTKENLYWDVPVTNHQPDINSVIACAVAPDGCSFVSGSWDGKLRCDSLAVPHDRRTG